VPVVFVAAIDPVATGVVTSLARPGGNVTGLTAVFADLVGKRLEILKEMLPTLTRVALLSRPANPGHVQYVQQAQMAAQILRVELEVMSANSPDEFESAFRGAQGVGAVIQIDEQANKFEMIVNLKTAKVLGLTISPSLVARADEVIE
jgi:putative tryptophan/tyrosine transport system substrate-binding protein